MTGRNTLALILISAVCLQSIFFVFPSALGEDSSRNTLAFGPYLQNMTQTSIVIRWNSTSAGTTTVNYGLTTSYGSTVSVGGTRTMHDVQITGLSVNTTYHYQVVSDDAISPDLTFKTAPPSGDYFEFFGLSDTQTNRIVRSQIFSLMGNYNGDFAVHAGDVVGDGGDWKAWVEFFEDATPLFNHIPLYPVRGNHDLGGSNTSWFFDFFSLPEGPAGERYYSFDYGNVHFLCLQTNGSAYYQNGSVENNWLRNDLIMASNNTSIDFIVVYSHEPPYGSGISHGSNIDVQNILCPIFKEYGVDLVLNGHNHMYERSQPPDGIIYLVMGGAGGGLVGYDNSNPYSVVKNSIHHFVHFKVMGKLMNITAISSTNTTIDSFEIDRRDFPPKTVPLTASDTGIGNSVDLNWTGYNETKEGVKSYRVYMSEGTFTDVISLPFIKEVGAGNQTLRVTNLTDYVKYYFAVVAEDIGGNKDPIVVPVNVTPTDKDPPAPPGPLTVKAVGFTNIRFDWNASQSNDVLGYLVFRNMTGAAAVPGGPYELMTSVSNTTLQYNMTGLSNGTQYRFIVKAFDDAIPPNNSTESTEANATTTIPNRVPKLISQGTIAMVEDQVLPGTFDVSAMFWDPEEDPLTYELSLADPGNAENVTISFKGGTGLQVKAIPDWNGAFDILVTATDGILSNIGLVHVTVEAINDPPVLHLKPEYAVYENQASEIKFDTTDVDGDQMTFTHELPSDLDDLPGDILSIDDAARMLRVNATNTMIGKHTIMVTVSDGEDTVSETFLLAVYNTNDPPEIPLIISPRDGAIFEHGDEIDFVTKVDDEDLLFGDKLEVIWYLDGNATPFGEGLYLLGVTGIADGDHEVTVVVSDTKDLSSEASGTFNVKSAETPPVQNKTCPDGSIIPVEGTCPQNNTTGCPGTKGPDSFFGKGLSMDYAILGAMILATLAVLIAIYSHFRKGDGPGKSAPKPKEKPSKPGDKGDQDEQGPPNDGPAEDGN